MDAAFCFSSCKAVLSGLSEQSFVIKGFTNWKDATRVFVKHESSDFHKQAVAALAKKADIGEMLSKQHALEKRSNCRYLLKVLSSLQFLA